MKRFLAFILAALMLLTLVACGSNGENKDPQLDNDQNQITPPTDASDSLKTSSKEMFGYSFTLDDGAIGEGFTYGYAIKTDTYLMFIYQYDDIDFDTWDNVAEKALDDLGDSVDDAFGFHPREQTNSTSTKTENDYGETILKVSGTMTGNQAGEGTVERQFIAFYYVTDENHVRFCVGVPKDDSSASYAALDAAMDTLIENLKKAA